MLHNISCDLDEVLLDVLAVRHLLDEICENLTGDLPGALQRSAWYTLDHIKEQLTAISEAAFEAATEAKKQQPEA